MKKAFLSGLCVILVATLVSPVLAFDGHRKGFILGGGMGFGSSSFTQTVELGNLKDTSPSESKGAFMTDFKIGFATNEQLEIFYASKVSWFSITNVFDQNVTVAHGVGAFGVTYNIKPIVPTFFVSGGIGFSTWGLPFEDPSPDTWLGFGLFAGGGYEFSKHYSVGLDILYGKPGDSEGSLKVNANVTTVKLTVNALAY